MNKLAFASLGFVALVTAAATSVAANRGVDLSLNPAHLDFTYHSPSGDLADLPMTPNTVHNPLILPCDVTLFGGELVVDYQGTGPNVFPRVDFSFFTAGGAVLPTSGCTGIPLATMPMDLGVMSAGTSQLDGYTPVAAPPAPFCAWQAQPANFPANQPVRMHLTLSGSTDAAHLLPIVDSNTSNNTVDVWVKRECSCN